MSSLNPSRSASFSSFVVLVWQADRRVEAVEAPVSSKNVNFSPLLPRCDRRLRLIAIGRRGLDRRTRQAGARVVGVKAWIRFAAAPTRSPLIRGARRYA